MTLKLPDRIAAERGVRLAIDRVLTTCEGAWVRLAGARRFREHRDIDPATGRTELEHLRERGVGPEVWPKLVDALDRGVPEADVTALMDKVTEKSSLGLAESLTQSAPQMLRDHRAIDRGMQRRMRAIWGPAFDAFYEIYVCAEEIGSDLQQLSTSEPLSEALLGLHARASLVLDEVHALMVAGFPLGAWARTRGLHETAVIATLLADHGRKSATADLADRFLRHAAVDEARDLELAERLGVGVDAAELERVRDNRANLVAQYGTMYAKDYGWARPLFPSRSDKARITFDQLEDLADSGLSRFDYRIAGHHVHASAWTVQLNTMLRGGQVFRLTGPTNVGFTAPATVAIASVLASTSAIIRGLNETLDPMDLVTLRALQLLSSSAAEKFSACQAVVDEREARLVRSKAPAQ